MVPLVCMTSPGYDFSDLSAVKNLQCTHLVIAEITGAALENFVSAFEQYPGNTFSAESVTLVVRSGNDTACNIRDVYDRIANTFDNSQAFFMLDNSTGKTFTRRQVCEGPLPPELLLFLENPSCKAPVN